MSKKIIGVTVGSPLPKPNLMQTDPNKGDYVKGKEEFLELLPGGGKGEKGDKGDPGPAGNDGQPGKDGVTPHIGSNENWFIGDTDTGKPSRGEAGKDGQNGQDGYTPKKGVDYFDGEPGADGKTPVKGEDYYTEADRQELVAEILKDLPENDMFKNLPVFDLNEMGMSAITLDGTIYECECDTTELMAALDRSIVRIRGDIHDGEEVIKGEGLFMQTMHVTDGVHQAVVRATMKFSGDFYDFRLIVELGIIYLSATPDNRSADVSAEIEEALEQAKASGAFDGKDGQNGKDGVDGKTPEKGVDYYTEAEKTEMVNAVIAALPTWTGGSY